MVLDAGHCWRWRSGREPFLTYLAQFFPSATHGWLRVATLLILIAIPTTANYLGVRQGANLSVLFTVAKLCPLALVISLGLLETGSPHYPTARLPPSHWSVWPKLLLILVYAFSGWEDALVPTGEVNQPRRTIPFALGTGLLICAFVYASFQLVIFQRIGASTSDRPVVEAATSLVGSGAGSFVAVAVMLSTYGWISGAFLNAPRFPVALSRMGDCPALFGKVHPRFRTPSVGILLYGTAVLLFAATGTFLWAIALTAGSLTIFYSVACAALIRLRRSQPHAPAFRLRLGRLLAVLGIGISGTLLTQLELRQLGLMSITALLAAGNWLWARRSAA
ncbi:MAG: amino acid/polyamine/organocation transporter, superfamily [Bryobacterales bacterium]|nr:amino acid/polyamine/organocation transporter, superfamily [Bryobacterales bacterium]